MKTNRYVFANFCICLIFGVWLLLWLLYLDLIFSLVKLNFSMFYKTFLQLTTFWQPYNNFGQMTIILYGRSNNFLLRGLKTWQSIFCFIFLIKWLSSWYCHKVTTLITITKNTACKALIKLVWVRSKQIYNLSRILHSPN